MAEKVLVTGADGFIGSHLVELLLAEGYKVRALSYYNSFNSWGWLEDLPKNSNLEIISGDIRDPFLCDKLCEGVDSVLHLAALIGIPYSYVAPDSYVDVNVKGTLNICQAAKHHKVKRVIHTSTSEVYGSAVYVPIDEKHPLQPQSPYSASKISADAMAMSYFYSFELPLTVARPFNTFGPRQSARAVIPTIISQIAKGQDTIKLGDVTTTRDFNFVSDTARGFLALLKAPASIGKTVNIGSGYEISVHDTIKLISKLMGKNVKVELDNERVRPKNSEVQRLCCDSKLLTELTGFKGKFNLEQGLQETIKWFSNPENLKKYKTDIYNV
ncbi:MAG: NAD-dependent 4,6-dehydratase LegB [Bdellovibrionota bacterium]